MAPELRISSSINSSPDIQGMLYSVLTDATDLLQIQSGAIYLADNARPGQMSLQAARPDAISGTPELFRQTFIPAVRVNTGKVYATSDDLSECIATPSGNFTIITVPLASKSRL